MDIPPPSVPVVERRAAVRRLCQRDAVSYWTGTPRTAAWLAQVRNISQTGIGLVLYCKFPPGTILAVQPLCLSTTRTLLVHVIHARGDTDGWYHGCELAAPLDENELGEWI